MVTRMFFIAIELAFVLLLIVGLVTQVLLPLFRGTAMFPVFRREAEIKGRIVEAQQRAREEDLEHWVPPEGRPLPEEDPSSPVRASDDDPATPKP